MCFPFTFTIYILFGYNLVYDSGDEDWYYT